MVYTKRVFTCIAYQVQRLACVCSVAACAVTAQAAEVQVDNVHMFRDIRGINDLGHLTGDRWQFGANISGGADGFSSSAVYAPTGFVVNPSPCGAPSNSPSLCSRSTAFNLSRLAEPWMLTFSKGMDSVTVAGPSLLPTQVSAPFPTSVTISNSSGQLTPTVSWALPAGYMPDGFRTNIHDKNRRLTNGDADTIFSTSLPVSANSLTIPAGLLQVGGNYTIDFQVIETIGDAPFTNRQTEILSRSRSYFAFAPLSASSQFDVHLPQVGVDSNPNDNFGAAYVFAVDTVGPNTVTFIDPFVAIGYDYATGTGDPNFASVIFPDVGDGQFELSYQGQTGLESQVVAAGDQYFFQAGGVSAFGVRGIETDAALDPGNTTAFITGLTFTAAGSFTGTMTPITEFIAAPVPEPETHALLLAGLGVVGLVGRRKRRAASASAKTVLLLVDGAC